MRPAQDDDVWDDPTPMWLSHHWPPDYDRCLTVRGRKVCRRCAVLYPLSLAAALVLGLGSGWPEHLDAWLLWLLPVPAVAEFIGEHLRLIEHSPRRLVAFTIPLAIACGRLYERYLTDQTDKLVWAVVGVHGGICLLAALLTSLRPRLP